MSELDEVKQDIKDARVALNRAEDRIDRDLILEREKGWIFSLLIKYLFVRVDLEGDSCSNDPINKKESKSNNTKVNEAENA